MNDSICCTLALEQPAEEWMLRPRTTLKMKSNSGEVSQYSRPTCNARIISDSDAALAELVDAPHETHEHIDDALRSFLAFTTENKRMESAWAGHSRYEQG